MVSYVFSGTKLVFLTADGRQYTLDKSNPRFNAVAKAIADKKPDDEVVAALSNMGSVKDYVAKHSNVEYRNGVVYVNGKELHNTVAKRVGVFAENGLPIEPLLKFIANLEANPSMRSREELYSFLEHSDIVLSDDGCFLAYKSVRSDYLDKYSRTFSNHVGAKHRMERRDVDDDANRTCSKGFHVGSILYAGPGGFYNSYGDRVMLVKVNPADAVSVPADHKAQKLRVCAYEVVGEVTGKLEHPLYTSNGNSYEYKPVSYDEVDFGGFDDFDDDYEDSDIYDDEYDYDDYEEDEDDLNLPPEIRF